MKLSAVILAGGKNSRIDGLDKAFLLLEEKPLIEKLVNVLTPIFDEIVIVTNSPEKYTLNPFLSDVIITTDIIKNIGPLGGIHSGLCTIKNDAAFVVACDMPYLDKNLILEQVKAFQSQKVDCEIAKCDNKIHPLHSIYSKLVLALIPEVIESGNFALMNLIDRCEKVSVMEFDPFYERCFTNINWASDVDSVEAQLIAPLRNFERKLKKLCRK